ncbi:Hypothetical predicted protein [Marmota monax]|uniref:Uncharacterized protein n=1 Tax=Marmota monax TaxID=9995 RepID=A0A5E4CPF2_MARMO|nr:Hypothetical predicted protein [Marmota monax]
MCPKVTPRTATTHTIPGKCKMSELLATGKTTKENLTYHSGNRRVTQKPKGDPERGCGSQAPCPQHPPLSTRAMCSPMAQPRDAGSRSRARAQPPPAAWHLPLSC